MSRVRRGIGKPDATVVAWHVHTAVRVTVVEYAVPTCNWGVHS